MYKFNVKRVEYIYAVDINLLLFNSVELKDKKSENESAYLKRNFMQGMKRFAYLIFIYVSRT